MREALAAGASFETLAIEKSRDATASRGGYLGNVRLADLLTEVRNAVEPLRPNQVSAPIRVGDTFVLFQVVPEAEARWIDLDEAGAEALSSGRNAEAVLRFEQAVDAAETGALGDARLVRSLDSLATVYNLQGKPVEGERSGRRALALLERMAAPDLEIAQALTGLGRSLTLQSKFVEAEAILERARSIREKALGVNHPEVGATLNRLAEVSAALGRFADASTLHDRAVETLEKSLGPDHPAAIASTVSREEYRRSLIGELLDRFSSLLVIAEFRDHDFAQVLKQVHELLALAPLSEYAFVQMKDVLTDTGLNKETEDVLRLSFARYPASRLLRRTLADLLADTGRTQDALALLQETSRMPVSAELDAAGEKRERAITQQRIGDMELALSHLEPALAEYQRSIETDPSVPAGRLKLARAYIAVNRLNDARSELERLARETPGDSDATLTLSEVCLALGQWEPAATAARRAIELGAPDPRALYLLGTALLRMGKADEGREHLNEFARIEQHFQDVLSRSRDVAAANSSAIAALHAGDGAGAVEQLNAALSRHPDAATLSMTLAMVQSRMGQHQKAIEILESMLARKTGRSFLIHKALSDEYAALGNNEASGRHRQIYLDTRESELLAR